MSRSPLSIKTLQVLDSEQIRKQSSYENVKVCGGDLSEFEFEDLYFDRTLLEGVIFNQVKIQDLKFSDSLVLKCSFVAADIEASLLSRTEFRSSRLQGVALSQARVEATTFLDSKLNEINLRYSKLKNTTFDSCDMSGADFIGADLKRVTFKNCNLSRSNFSNAVLKDVDFAGSTIDNIIISPEAVKEVFVDTGQALYLSAIFGLKIRD
jgi:uncharacterized protein YjbI with pentapeptide repeats